jgi:hypothetical protein
MPEIPWQREAITWRFKWGASPQEIADAYGLSLPEVEDAIRDALSGPRADTTSSPADAAPRRRQKPQARRSTARTTRTPRDKTARPTRPPVATDEATSHARAKPGEWKQKALHALGLNGGGSAMISELATRLRLKDAERQAGIVALYGALQPLVRTGQVTKQGTRYQLARGEAPA